MPQNSIALVPAYKPDSRVFSVVDALKKEGFAHILAVSDGNSAEYEPILSALGSDPDVTLLRHSVNQGKGRALKTAFDYILNNFPGYSAVAVDCDGQLLASDAAKAARLAQEHPDSLILGCRDLRKTENVPAASKFGNFTTRITVFLLTGVVFSDTQCGLRAYPPQIMKKLLAVGGERFEFENNTLIEVRKKAIPVVEYRVNVIYEKNEGYTTTFRRIRDSILIYKNLLSFLCAPAMSFLLATVLWFLSAAQNLPPWAMGLSYGLAVLAAAALSTLAAARVTPVIVGGAGLGCIFGAAAFHLAQTGLIPRGIWTMLFIPVFWGLCVIYRRLGFGPRPRILRK